MMHILRNVEGIVTEGKRIASGLGKNNPFDGSTIKMQIPLFKKYGLDISNCYPGTLNVSIAPRVRRVLLEKPQYCGLKWHPDYPAEDFFIFKCLVHFDGNRHAGWVYYPDPSKKIGFQHKPDVFEILAPFIPKITYGDSVVLTLDLNDIEIT